MHSGRIPSASLVALLAALAVSCGETPSNSLPPAYDVSTLGGEVRAALAEPQPLTRSTRLAEALVHLDPENLDEVRSVYDIHISGLDELEVRPFLDAWADFDGPAAFEYARGIRHRDVRSIGVDAALYGWAVRDPRAATDAIAESTAARQMAARSGDMTRPVVRGWAASGDERGLESFVRANQDPGQLVLVAFPEIYRRRGTDAVARWASRYIRDEQKYGSKMKVFRMAVRVLGFRDPAGAAPFVLGHWGEDYASEGPRALAEGWIRTGGDGPDEVMEWLRTEAPESTRSYAMVMAVGAWLRLDLVKARDWIEALPTGDPFYQPAFDALAYRMSRRSPRRALPWCSRGDTETFNRDCVFDVATRWYQRDPVAAGEWIEEESGLSEEDRVAVRARAKRTDELVDPGAG